MKSTFFDDLRSRIAFAHFLPLRSGPAKPTAPTVAAPAAALPARPAPVQNPRQAFRPPKPPASRPKARAARKPAVLDFSHLVPFAEPRPDILLLPACNAEPALAKALVATSSLSATDIASLCAAVARQNAITGERNKRLIRV
jgi:hypothetical protein